MKLLTEPASQFRKAGKIKLFPVNVKLFPVNERTIR